MIGPSSIALKLHHVIFATLILSTISQDLSNLGNEISDAVNRQLTPLQNLGARINEQVNRNIALSMPPYYHNYAGPERYRSRHRGIPDLGSRISAQVHDNVRSMDDLNYNIQQNVNRELAPLNNLGQHIQETVNKGLEPVRAMELVYKMKSGVGGTTIASYLPSGIQLIVDNYQTYQCSGNIAADTGKCNGDLKPFIVRDKHDYCYLTTSYSIVNNQICVGANSISVINNQIKCESFSNQPVLLMDLNDFKKLCEDVSNVEYKYIADYMNPGHVEIPNKNPHVRCENDEKGVCIFKQNIGLAGNPNVVINNRYSYTRYEY